MFVDAYKSITYANNVVSNTTFTKRYLGHVSKRLRNTVLGQQTKNMSHCGTQRSDERHRTYFTDANIHICLYLVLYMSWKKISDGEVDA